MNNRPTRVTSALDGTKTAENLRMAFSKEAENFARDTIFSSVAREEGEDSAKRLFDEHSDNDKRHAELWLGYLDEISDTIENLAELSALKSALGDNLYPAMAEIADEEGFEEIAEKMRLAARTKNAQMNLLRGEIDRIKNPESLFSENAETTWHCHSCGYDVKGNMPPERCPLCSYPSSSFSQM